MSENVRFDVVAASEVTPPGSPITLDPPGIAMPARDGAPVYGIVAAIPSASGRASIATAGVVELTIAQWEAVVDDRFVLLTGSAYYTTRDGRLSRVPYEGATRVGVAISATQLRVQIQHPDPRREAWIAKIRAPSDRRKRVEIRDLCPDLAELAGIWRGFIDRPSMQIHDEIDYMTCQAVAIHDRASDRVLLFLEAGASTNEDVGRRRWEGTSGMCDEIYALPIALWHEIGAPTLLPIKPPILVNLVHRTMRRLAGSKRSSGLERETDVLRAIDERTDLAVLEVGTEDIADQYPHFVFTWNPEGWRV